MTHASLFSGIGGFDLASEWMGWTNVFNCDIEEFPRKVLKYHFPNAIQYDDIKKTDFTIHAGQVDVLTGGFPCQPYSSAGKRLGKEDERHLWPEMLRAIREIKPRWVIGENVRGLLSWNDGLVFEEVHTDLETEGYEVQSFILPAAGINAPHRRDRIWFVAHANGSVKRNRQRENPKKKREVWRNEKGNVPRELSSNGDVAHTSNKIKLKESQNNKRQACKHLKERGEVWHNTRTVDEGKSTSNTISEQPQRISTNQELEGGRLRESYQQGQYWETFPTQSPICRGDDGLPQELDSITFSKWRRESIKGYGNAIVPQIAYRLFQSIQLTEEHND